MAASHGGTCFDARSCVFNDHMKTFCQCLIPKSLGKLGMKQHAYELLHDGAIHPLSYCIMLWRIWDYHVMTNALLPAINIK